MENQQVTQLRSETDPRKPAAYFFFFLLPFLLFLLFFLIIRKSPLDFHLVFSDELDYWGLRPQPSSNGACLVQTPATLGIVSTITPAFCTLAHTVSLA
jgi:hypothetical protein